MKAKNAPTIRLSIKTYDPAGNLLTEETKTNDIFVYNWAAFIAAWLKAAFTPSITGTYGWKNTNGEDKTSMSAEFGGLCTQYDNVIQGNWANNAFVQIGAGNNAPLISDYCLQTFITEATPTPPAIVLMGNVIKIIFTTTFSFPTETVIGETGIRMMGGISKDFTDAGKYLITRDIFTPATVPANGTVSIQHELWFNGTP